MSLLDRYFIEPLDRKRGLQQQVHERLVEAILDGGVPPHEPLPPTRELADQIGVSRNTVVLVYERMVEDGYLTPVKRRGHFINEQYVRQQLNVPSAFRPSALFRGDEAEGKAWAERLRLHPSRNRNIVKPANWRDFRYPFIYGQVTTDKVSIARWRDCTRLAGTPYHANAWVGDLIDADDPLLVEQVISRVLPQRGLKARPEEVLITIGSQNALYMVANLLAGPGVRVGVEDPGYVDARNIWRVSGAELVPLSVDGNGIVVDERLVCCSIVYVTPSHQSPTSVTMSLSRRLALVEAARQRDLLLIEDDYEHELNFIGAQRGALKSFDNSGRTIYLGSLSKALFPGLRLGFVVAPEPLIREMRALRRLMYRHPSGLDQRAMAIFILEGHLDAHIRRSRDQLARKWTVINREIGQLLPDCRPTVTTGGSSVWLRLPAGIDCWDLQRAAARRSVLIEPGDIHFLAEEAPRNFIRLGFAALGLDQIAPGLAELQLAIDDLRRGGA